MLATNLGESSILYVDLQSLYVYTHTSYLQLKMIKTKSGGLWSQTSGLDLYKYWSRSRRSDYHQQWWGEDENPSHCILSERRFLRDLLVEIFHIPWKKQFVARRVIIHFIKKKEKEKKSEDGFKFSSPPASYRIKPEMKRILDKLDTKLMQSFNTT